MKPDKITQSIYDAREEDAEAIIKVCEPKKKHRVEGFECCGKEYYYLNEIIVHMINDHPEQEWDSIIEKIDVVEG